MNNHTTTRAPGHGKPRTPRPRARRRVLVIAAALGGTLAAHGAVGATSDADVESSDQPIWAQVVARQELRRTVALMPAGWPATEAMRVEAEQAIGDAAQRERWRRTAALMPAGWPATEAMLADLDR